MSAAFGESGFGGAYIHPECLRLGDDDSVRVALSVPADDWFDLLTRLGETLQLTRNAAAVLGQLGSVPALVDWRNPVLPRDRDGLFTPNLAEYAGLWAVREWSPIGWRHGFEARDISGTAFQRIMPCGSAHLGLFEQFVIDHQSPPEEASRWFPPNHTSNTRRSSSIAGRVPWLRQRLAQGAGDVRLLPVGFASQVFNALERTGLPIRSTLYSRAVIRKAVWKVEAHQSTPNNRESELPFCWWRCETVACFSRANS